ncbi:MAG: hypothetical protein Q9212_001028 [Teloschistes hypoglaucus]
MTYPKPFQTSILLLSFAELAFTFTAYKPNCSESPNGVNYLSPPEYRGTLDIVWSCFAIVFTCTWAVQHLSVPLAEEAQTSASDQLRKPKSSLQRIKTFLSSLKTPEAIFLARKLRWMLLSIAAPEFVLGKAMAERWAAVESKRQSDVDGWTTMHAFFANMRGFVLRFNVNAVKMPLKPSEPDELRRSLHRLRPGPFLHGEAPYYEQDPLRAEQIEFDHANLKSREGKEKPNDHEEATKTSLDTRANPEPLPEDAVLEQQSNLPPPSQGLNMGVRSTLQRTTPDISLSLFTPHSLSRRHTAEPLTLATPTTLVNSPRTPSHSPALSGTSPASQHRADFAQHQSATVSPSTPIGPAALFANMTFEKGAPRTYPTWTASWPLNSMQIQYAQQNGIIPRSTFVAHEALKDRSKGDSFIKGFAILQITALVIQIIARSFQDLATTLLEVNVLAFAACAIVTYIFLWHKPQDVKVPIYIDIAPTVLTRGQIIDLAARAPVATLVIKDYWLHGVSIRAQSDNVFPWTPGIRLKLPFNSTPMLVSPVIFGIGGGGLIFGAIHFVAWNFHFPTPVERLLWRMSCTVLIVFPLIGTAFYWTMQRFAAKLGVEDTKVNRALRPMSWVIGLVYLLARGYLVVEVFRDLAYPQPSISQQVNWPSLISYLD